MIQLLSSSAKTAALLTRRARPSLMPKKFYAVRHGKQRGVFETWEETARMVSGVPHSTFKAFATRVMAETWLQGGEEGLQGTGAPGLLSAVRFYGIRVPQAAAGVYTDWDRVKSSTDGVPGACFKGGFVTFEDALRWVEEGGVKPADEPHHLQPLTAASAAPPDYSQDAHPAPQHEVTAQDEEAQPAPVHAIQADNWYRLEFDGGSRGNPGPAGYGSVLRSAATGKLVQAVAGIIPYPTTNNQAEYAALLAGLEAAHALGVRNMMVQGDSELIVRQIKGQYKASEKGGLSGLRDEAKMRLAKFKRCDVKHVYRDENKDADLMGNLAMDVLACVPIRPLPYSAENSEHLIQQLILSATNISSSNGSSSIARQVQGQQGEGDEHVSAQVRAHMLRQLFLQWSSSIPPASEGSAARESSRPVVINLPLVHSIEEQTQQQSIPVKSKSRVRADPGSHGKERKKRKAEEKSGAGS